MRTSRLLAWIVAVLVVLTATASLASAQTPTTTPPDSDTNTGNRGGDGRDDEHNVVDQDVTAQARSAQDGIDATLTAVSYTADTDGGLVTQPAPIPAWLMQCRWPTKTGKDIIDTFGAGQIDLSSITEPDENYTYLWCPPGPSDSRLGITARVTGFVDAWPQGDPLPAVALTVVINQAYASVRVPTDFGVSSPPGDQTIPMITQLDTWLWLDETHWQPRSAQATLGSVTVTATLTPYKVDYIGGPDQTVTCTQATAIPYDLAKAENQQQTDCKLVYRQRGNHFLTTQMHWTATYTCNTQCTSGTLPDVTRANRRPIIVEEWNAINT